MQHGSEPLTFDLPPPLATLVEARLPEVRRRLGMEGAAIWVQGAERLHRLGRGDAVVQAWLQAMPDVARALGPDVLDETAQYCLGFASRASGAVIERILATAPTAARRLGDAGLFRSYLGFLDHLLARAPRGMRPMLDHLDELFDVLSLGGLRRWADWGAEAHRTDYPELDRYFALQSETSRAVLKAERRGLLLVDVQRRLDLYLRALWGRGFGMIPTSGDFETRQGLRPTIHKGQFHLPDALDDTEAGPALNLYRAQVAHLAAHVAFPAALPMSDALTPLQRQCIELAEDARVDLSAIARFPGLKALWLPFHAETRAGMAGVFDRIARSLLSQAGECPLSEQAVAHFMANPQDTTGLGQWLANALVGVEYSPYRDRPGCPYRCDNIHLWDAEELADAGQGTRPPEQTRRNVSLMEMINEVEVETAGEDAQEIWVQSALLLDDDGKPYNPEAPARSARVLLDEFDYKTQMRRPSWVSLRDYHVPVGATQPIADIRARYRPQQARLLQVLERMRPRGMQLLRRQQEGDALDLNAAIQSAIDLRRGSQPDDRVMQRQKRVNRDVAVLVLLDLSESTNDHTAGGQTVMDLTRAATVLLADAMQTLGDRFALHGFCSDGRADVQYRRFKDFAEPWAAKAEGRLANASGQLSTRMGAAIRHASDLLSRTPAQRRLLLVLTDGAPADIDVRDADYLLHDTKDAVQKAESRGIMPYCLTLDPMADAYAARIFGQRNVQVLDRVESLPDRLPSLYARLMR